MSARDSVSVIICVHSEKRWDAILEAVASVRSQSHPVLETLIVVDHNAELERRLGESLQGVTVVPNNQDQGLSGARNTGVALAKGDLLLFLDDDAVLEPDWVREAVKHFGSGKTLGVTSRIVPRWQGIRPFWFPDEFLWVVGCTYEGMRPGAVEISSVLRCAFGAMCSAASAVLINVLAGAAAGYRWAAKKQSSASAPGRPFQEAHLSSMQSLVLSISSAMNA